VPYVANLCVLVLQYIAADFSTVYFTCFGIMFSLCSSFVLFQLCNDSFFCQIAIVVISKFACSNNC